MILSQNNINVNYTWEIKKRTEARLVVLEDDNFFLKLQNELQDTQRKLLVYLLNKYIQSQLF